ncbi:MAG: alpha-L-fucosidase [Verrucomicrobiota bacterium]|nr:alpha-L-fucosidase [Verrucomicrobiota bacterium]
MKNRILLTLAAFTCCSFPAVPAPTHLDETPAQRDARMAWWRQARFGMFIHWGLYSEAAGYWQGQPTRGAGEWIMNDMRIPRSQYATLASHFDPVKFNADDWVRTAKAAGMKYLVITSKHHDGFCMFHTRATPYNVVDGTPWRKDPLLALSKACRRQGVKFCVYYSIMDWHSPDQEPADPDPAHPTYNPTRFVPGKKRDYIRYMKTELKELITQYHPAVLWFDGQWMNGWTDEDGRALYRYLRSLDPALIVNNRVKGAGDYETPEQHIPPQGLPGHDWETCMTMNDTWGYKKEDHHWKSTQTLIRNLVDIASKGGNYLLNVGPTGEGLIPEASVERLREIGKWLKVNGSAIYGTTASPFTRQLPWGRCTMKVSGDATTLYLHVFEWPPDGRLLVPGLMNMKSKITSAYLLADPLHALGTETTADGTVVSVPASAPDKISSTVVLKFKGASEIVAAPILQKPDGSVLLPASEARLHGSTLQYESGGPLDDIGYWTNPEDWADWEFKVERPGKFTVSAVIAAPAPASFELSAAGQTLRCAAPVTGSYVTFKPVELGVIEISVAGRVTLAVHPVKAGWQPMNLKAVKLTPVVAGGGG